jgi:hypothetical protein
MKKQYVVKKNRSLMALCALLWLTALTLNSMRVQAQSFTGLNSPYCSNNAPVTLTGSAAPAGTFTGPGITDNGNGTATFNPATQQAPVVLLPIQILLPAIGQVFRQAISVPLPLKPMARFGRGAIMSCGNWALATPPTKAAPCK